MTLVKLAGLGGVALPRPTAASEGRALPEPLKSGGWDGFAATCPTHPPLFPQLRKLWTCPSHGTGPKVVQPSRDGRQHEIRDVIRDAPVLPSPTSHVMRHEGGQSHAVCRMR